jgi:hypothetical protein
MTLDDKKNAKNAKLFICEPCDFKCCKQSNLDKHYLTLKHKKNDIELQENAKNADIIICECGKEYKFRQGLWKHKKKCIQKEVNLEERGKITDIGNNITPELIIEIIKQNQELQKQNNELQKQMMEVIKNGTNNIINNTNSNNKTKFNLNFFLNETCKDAMNITDFVSSIKLQLTDLENVGKNGYINGISNIIVKNLNALELTKRPVHCSDLKREIMYVKDENKWEKEKEKEKLAKAINKVSYKNVLQIPAWQKEHPGCEYSHSKENDKYLHMVHESMGASTEEEKKENINKIITKIAKEVVIEKEGE